MQNTPRTDKFLQGLGSVYDSSDQSRNNDESAEFMRQLEIELREALDANARICLDLDLLKRTTERAFRQLDALEK